MTTERIAILAIRLLGIYYLKQGLVSAISVIPTFFKLVVSNNGCDPLLWFTYFSFIIPVIIGILLIIKPQLVTMGISYTKSDFDLGAIYQLILKIAGLMIVINSGRLLLVSLNSLQKNLSSGMMHDYMFYEVLNLVIQVCFIILGIVMYVKSKSISEKENITK